MGSFVATVVAVYVLPVALLFFGFVPFEWRFRILIGMAIATGLISLSHGHGRKDLGLPRKAGRLTRLALAALLLVLAAMPALPAQSAAFFGFYVLISAPVQEFLYRSFLFARMKASSIRPGFQVLCSASLFSFMHVIYRDAALMGLAFAAGILWAWLYQQTRSFFLVAASHSILGATAIWYGVI